MMGGKEKEKGPCLVISFFVQTRHCAAARIHNTLEPFGRFILLGDNKSSQEGCKCRLHKQQIWNVGDMSALRQRNAIRAGRLVHWEFSRRYCSPFK